MFVDASIDPGAKIPSRNQCTGPYQYCEVRSSIEFGSTTLTYLAAVRPQLIHPFNRSLEKIAKSMQSGQIGT